MSGQTKKQKARERIAQICDKIVKGKSQVWQRIARREQTHR